MEKQNRFPSLRGRISADAAVIGGGFSGVTIALWLAKSGLKVAVAEAFRMGSGATGCCAGIVSLINGTSYAQLEAEYGIVVTDAYVRTQISALQTIRKMASDHDFGWTDVPLQWLETDAAGQAKMHTETEVMKRAGIPVTILDEKQAEWKGAALLDSSAYFEYLMAEAIRHGVCFREGTRITAVDTDTLYTDSGSIRAPYLIVASGYPVINTPGWFFLRMEQQKAWRVASSAPVSGCTMLANGQCRIHQTANGSLLYIRAQTDGACPAPAEWVKNWIPEAENILLDEQTGWECITMDGLPFIGAYSRKTPNLFVATGYGGNGIIGSMMAAQAISARVLGLPSEGYEIYTPQRSWKPRMTFSIAGRYLKGMISRPYAPRCPHMGCRLVYQKDRRIWECPCHGSCFDDIGHVVNGPSVHDARVTRRS